jgi:hypothetical protein
MKLRSYQKQVEADQQIRKTASEVDEIRRSIQRKTAELELKKEKAAWEKFRVALNESVPPYELVRDGSSNAIYSITSCDQLINALIGLKTFRAPDDLPYLKSYAAKNSGDFRKTIHEILDSLRQCDYKPMKPGDFLRFSGKAILLSSVKNALKYEYKFDEVHVCASRVIYVDCDWNMGAKNVALSAPQIRVVGGRRRIATSGKDAATISEKKADDARHAGANGDHGAHGAAGESAGHVTIKCDQLVGALHIEANGGQGADGQDGGDGRNGRDGSDGSDGHATKPDEGIGFWNVGLRSRDSLKSVDEGTTGRSGMAGGCGGEKGLGGQGGLKGSVCLAIANGEDCTTEARDGRDGQDGNPGSGGIGGKGGWNGRDHAYVFTPKYTWGLGLSGDWHSERGRLKIYPIINKNDVCHGYRLTKLSDDNGRATDGENGHQLQGTRAQSTRKRATQTKQMSTVQHCWDASASSCEQEISADIASQVDSIRRLEAEQRNKESQLELEQEKSCQVATRMSEILQQKAAVERERQDASSRVDQLLRNETQLAERKNQLSQNVQQLQQVVAQQNETDRLLQQQAQAQEASIKQLAQVSKQLAVEERQAIDQKRAEVGQASAKHVQAQQQFSRAQEKVAKVTVQKQSTEKAVIDKRAFVSQCHESINVRCKTIQESGQKILQYAERLENLKKWEHLKDKVVAEAQLAQRVSQQIQRIGQAPEIDSDELIVTPQTHPTDVVSAQEIQFLDEMISNFGASSADARKVLALSSLAQQLALQINKAETWASIRRIVQHPDTKVDLVECLAAISANAGIVHLIESNGAQRVTECIRKAVTKENLPADTTRVMYLFSRHPWQYQDIRKLIKQLEKIDSHPQVVEGLTKLLVHRIVAIISEMVQKCVPETPVDGSLVEAMLCDVSDFCIVQGREVSIGSFYDDLVSRLKGTKTLANVQGILE